MFASDLEGHQRPLSAWHETEIGSPRLIDAGRYVAYACETPEPGLYAAPTAAVQNATAAVIVRAESDTGSSVEWWSGRPLVAAGHLVRLVGGALQAFPLDGSLEGQARTLADDATGPLVVDPDLGRVVFARAGEVATAGVGGGEDPVVVMRVDGYVQSLAVLPGSGRVLVAWRKNGASTTVIQQAPLDGSGASAPTLVAEGLPGWFMSMVATQSGGHVLAVLSVEATAVPHPDQLLVAATGVSNGAQTGPSYAVAPSGFLPWGVTDGFMGPVPSEPRRAISSASGEHVILVGPGGLYTALADGSEPDAPRLLGTTAAPLGEGPSPDGRRLLLQQEDGGVAVSTLGEAGSQRTVVAPASDPLVGGAWTPDGERIVFWRRHGAGWKDEVTLYVATAAVDGQTGARLHPTDFSASRMGDVAPSGRHVVVESTHGSDHSLYLVSLDPADAAEAPPPITPVDDVAETFLGFLPVR